MNNISDEVYVSPHFKNLDDKDNAMKIVYILDRSGSMSSVRQETIDGFNKYVEAQKKNPWKTTMSLILFDDQYDVLYEELPIQDVELLNDNTFIPRGSTALYDAIGKTINTLGEKISQSGEKNKAILVVIQTDGEENASREYDSKSIKTCIDEKTQNSWEFVYLGANQNVFLAASTLGIKKSNLVHYANSKVSVNKTYENLENASYRWATRSFCGMPEGHAGANLDFFMQDEQDTTDLSTPKYTNTGNTLNIKDIQNVNITDTTLTINTPNVQVDLNLPNGLK